MYTQDLIKQLYPNNTKQYTGFKNANVNCILDGVNKTQGV